jgi:uncharacterized protein (DUF2252 family)
VARLAASVDIAGRDLGHKAKARNASVRATLRAYRETMREFAGMRHVDVWYARLDAAGALERAGRALSRDMRDTVRKRIAKAHAKDSLRALSKLTHTVDGSLRIVSDPPLIVPVEELVGDGAEAAALEESMQRLIASYARSLRADRRTLMRRYHYVHLARKVVGVGSVGTRAWVVLLQGRDCADPLFLQVKEAQASVLEPYAGTARQRNHGQRVVEGQWLMQAASDIFLGWLRATGLDGVERDFYLRQLWDWKTSVDLETLSAQRLETYAGLCGWTLARAHARSGDRIAIAAYLGGGDGFDQALATFAEAYADCNDRDHAALAEAARAGEIAVQTEA